MQSGVGARVLDADRTELSSPGRTAVATDLPFAQRDPDGRVTTEAHQGHPSLSFPRQWVPPAEINLAWDKADPGSNPGA